MIDQIDRLRDEDATPTPARPKRQPPMQTLKAGDEIEAAKNKNRLGKNIVLSTQCAPLAASEAVQRQVVV